MSIRPRALTLLAVTALVALSCSSPNQGALPRNARSAFGALEERLLDAINMRCDSRLTAEGAVTADLICRHEIGAGGRARVRATGEFMGERVDFVLYADGERMRLSSRGEGFELDQPEDLRGGLVHGLTRMGWLHNVAALAMGGQPDATDGSASEFARALDLAGGDDLELGGRDRRALTFSIEVHGEPAGTAVLWLDVESGLPLERWQRVEFPGGEMRVVEVYERFELDLPGSELGPDGFL